MGKSSVLSKTGRGQQPAAVRLRSPLARDWQPVPSEHRADSPPACQHPSYGLREGTKPSVSPVHHWTACSFLKQYCLIGVKIASSPHCLMRGAFRLSKKCLGLNKVTHSLASDECLAPLSPPQQSPSSTSRL